MTWMLDFWKNLPFNRLDFDRCYVVDQVLSQKPRSSVMLVRRNGESRQTVMKLSDPAATNPLEKQCLDSLRHPGIASLLGYGVTRDRRIWMETEYIDGVTFSAWLDEHPAAFRPYGNRPRSSEVFSQLLSAIQYLHCCGWLHGDLSPQNVLVTRGARKAVLVDFEHSRPIHGHPKDTMPRRHSLPFASPHEIGGGPTTESCEQFALGKLGMMLFGVQADKSRVSSPSSGIDAVLSRASSELPEDRYPDLHHFELDFRANCHPANCD